MLLTQIGKVFRSILTFALSTLLIVVGAVAWRLSTGERINTDFFGPYIRELLGSSEQQVDIRIGQIQAGWDVQAGGKLLVQASETKIYGRNGKLLGIIPDFSLEIAAKSFFYGVMGPEKIVFKQPKLFLYRYADGSIDLGEAPASASHQEKGVSGVIGKFIRQLLAPPDYRNPTGFLSYVQAIEAEVAIFDENTQEWWNIPKADIIIERFADGVQGHLTAEMQYHSQKSLFDLTFTYRKKNQQIEIVGQIKEMPVQFLGSFEKKIDFFQQTSLLVSGWIKLSLNLQGKAEKGLFNIALSPGTIKIPLDPTQQEILVEYGSVVGELTDQGNKLIISSFQLATTEGMVEGMIELGGLRKANNPSRVIQVQADLSLQDFSLSSVIRLWPSKIFPNVRPWVIRNIHSGHIDMLDVQTNLEIPMNHLEDSQLKFLEGKAQASKLLINYMPNLPLLQAETAVAHFDRESLQIDFFNGISDTNRLSTGNVLIAGLSQPDQMIKIDMVVDASLSKVLLLLQGLMPDTTLKTLTSSSLTSGDVRGNLHIEFPLIKNLTWKNVEISAETQLEKVVINNIIPGIHLKEGQFRLQVKSSYVALEGKGQIDQQVVQLTWQKDFNIPSSSEDITAKFDVSTTTLKRWLHLPAAAMSGPQIPIQLYLNKAPTGIVKIELRSNLQNVGIFATLTQPLKQAGVKTDLLIRATLQPGKLLTIEDLLLQGQPIQIQAKGNFTLDASSFSRGVMTFSKVKVGATNVPSLQLEFGPKETVIVMKGGQIDAAQFLQISEEFAGNNILSFKNQAIRLLNEQPIGLLFGPDRQLVNAYINLSYAEQHWRILSVEAGMGQTKKVSFRYGAGQGTGAGPYMLNVFTDDTGELLRIMTGVEGMKGGNLRVQASSVTDGGQDKLQGKISIDRFTLDPKAAFGPNSSSILQAFAGAEGIIMTRFSGQFDVRDGRITINNLRTNGETLGVTAEGWIDIRQSQINIRGDFVPFYAINGVLSDIPIIGHILTGGPGKGIFAAKYNIQGPLDKPSVKFSALSALAPGFLRELFNANAP